MKYMEIVDNLLSELGYKVFNTEKPLENEEGVKINYPYVIYSFPTTNFKENNDDIILKIDIWTNNISECYTMTDTIKKVLHKYSYLDNNIGFDIYRINRINNILDEDEEVKRNQLRFLIKKYD